MERKLKERQREANKRRKKGEQMEKGGSDPVKKISKKYAHINLTPAHSS